MSAQDPQPNFLTIDSGQSAGARIAYHGFTPSAADGEALTIVFLGGFMSDMTGTKALFLEGWARSRGFGFLRFDYEGHGASSGRFDEGTIGRWAGNAASAIEALTTGSLVLVGSSMGGWIASLLLERFRARIKGLVGLAAAPDFTERMWAHDLTDDERRTITRDGRVLIPSEYGPDPYVFTHALFEDGRAQSVLSKPLQTSASVRLIQGTADPDVPWETAIKLAEHMKASGSEDVEAILVPGADHRLSSETDLARLSRILEAVTTPSNG